MGGLIRQPGVAIGQPSARTVHSETRQVAPEPDETPLSKAGNRQIIRPRSGTGRFSDPRRMRIGHYRPPSTRPLRPQGCNVKVSDMNHAWVITSLLMLACTVGCNRAEPTSSDTSAPVPVESSMGVGVALHTDADPTVVLNTSQGPIKLRLNPAKAPLTVDNFLSQIDNGFYHQTIFHEVTPGFAILAGGVRPDLTEKQGVTACAMNRTTACQIAAAASPWRGHADGIDSDTGQFFINVADNPRLDYQADTPEQCGYCVFGEVVEGMDVVDRIAQLPTHSDGDFPQLPVRAALIESATKAR